MSETRQQRRARERDEAKAKRPARLAGEPSPYGPRPTRRIRFRQPAPAPLPQQFPRLARTHSRPRPNDTQAPHRDSHYGVALLNGMGARDMRVYGGTVPWAVTRDRRQRNKLAGAARVATRKAAG